MAKRWTKEEEIKKHEELIRLYIKDNKSISEVGKVLNLAGSSVYDRLVRLGIKTNRTEKLGYNNKRHDFIFPRYSKRLSEFIGIMLGDGHINPNQVTVTLGNKEVDYVKYVANNIGTLFHITPKTATTKSGYYIIYFGSTDVVQWLLKMGLVFNKVKKQVDIPQWIFSKKGFIQGFLRGFFDTDGSIYKIRYGVQLAFTNRSIPMLKSIRKGLITLEYLPSQISHYRIYLTRQEEILRFYAKINPANPKHKNRFSRFMKCVGSPVGAGAGL